MNELEKTLERLVGYDKETEQSIHGYSLGNGRLVKDVIKDIKLIKQALADYGELKKKFNELFENPISISLGRMNGKTDFFKKLNELKELCKGADNQ